MKFKKSSERKLQDFFFSVYKVLANEIIEIIAEIFRGGLIVKPVEKTVTPTCQLIRELIRDKSSTALRNWDFLTDTTQFPVQVFFQVLSLSLHTQKQLMF